MEVFKRTALYGGTFDPVHHGHMAVASRLLELFALDEVLFIPAHVAPHKRSVSVTPALHRYAMLALATQYEERFRISSIEIDEPRRPYTVDTLARLRAELGARARLFFVMGADSWGEITTWRSWERVLSLTDHIVVTRPGYELSAAHVPPSVGDRIVDLRDAGRETVAEVTGGGGGNTARIFLTNVVDIDVSSTFIRQAAHQRADLVALVTPPVADYISKYKLYRGAHEPKFSDAGIYPG